MKCPRCGEIDRTKFKPYYSLTSVFEAGLCKVCYLIFLKTEVLDKDFCIVHKYKSIYGHYSWKWFEAENTTRCIANIDEIYQNIYDGKAEEIVLIPANKDPLKLINSPQFKRQFLARRMK